MLTPIEAAGPSDRFSRRHSTSHGGNVQRKSPLTSWVMSAFKTVLKIMFVLVVVGCITGVIKVQTKPKDAEPVSFDEWPDVPRNPATE